MSASRRFLGLNRPLIGVVHLAALPGSPAHRGGMQRVADRALRDVVALTTAGVDALIIENYGDAPFWKGDVPAVTVAAMSALLLAVKDVSGEAPLGVNCLRNDALAALSIAAAVGADFIRVNVLTGAMLTDQGVIEGRAAEVARLRAALCPKVQIAADVLVKHATPLAPVDPAQATADLVGRGGADAVIVTGAHTGGGVDPERVRVVRDAAGRHPVLLGSGVRRDNVAELLPLADGAIVGSALKRGGRAENPVDRERAMRFAEAYRRARG
jgi:membrane complex biogenesis BtpA family protein